MEIEFKTRQARKPHVFKITTSLPENYNFDRWMYDDETGQYVSDGNGDYIRDERQYLTDEWPMRSKAREEIREWLILNVQNYREDNPKALVPYDWTFMDISVVVHRNKRQMVISLTFGEPIFHYMVQSDWTTVTGDIVQHADNKIYMDRESAEKDAERSNKSPWTIGGRRGFYVSKKEVTELGEEVRCNHNTWADETHPNSVASARKIRAGKKAVKAV